MPSAPSSDKNNTLKKQSVIIKQREYKYTVPAPTSQFLVEHCTRSRRTGWKLDIGGRCAHGEQSKCHPAHQYHFHLLIRRESVLMESTINVIPRSTVQSMPQMNQTLVSQIAFQTVRTSRWRMHCTERDGQECSNMLQQRLLSIQGLKQNR